jgi:Pectate lyase superfamily protein
VAAGSLAHPAVAEAGVLDEYFYPEDYGAVGNGATDDTAALQDCIDAALAADRGAVVYLSNLYAVEAAPRTDRHGNCILSLLPPNAQPGDKTQIMITGPQGSPHIGGVKKVGFITTRTSPGYSSTYGPPSVLGTVTAENGGSGISWMGPIQLRNFSVQIPNGSGLSGIDLLGSQGIDISKSVSVIYGTGTDLTSPPTTMNFGYRYPTLWGSGLMRTGGHAYQAYCGHLFHVADHVHFDHTYGYQCNTVAAFMDPATSSHPGAYGYLMADHSKYAITGFDFASGIKSIAYDASTMRRIYLMRFNLDLEGGPSPFQFTAIFLDANNMLYGDAHVHYTGGLGVGSSLPMTGGDNLDLYTTLHRAGNRKLNVRSLTAASPSLVGYEQVVQCDASSNNQTISLPTAVDNTGRQFVFKKVDASSNTVTIDPNGTETIDGATTLVLRSRYDSVWITSTGSSWIVLARRLGGAQQTYSVSGVTTDRAFNANATSTDELADVLGTLISDLRARGLVL